jgi:hypothetical protein
MLPMTISVMDTVETTIATIDNVFVLVGGDAVCMLARGNGRGKGVVVVGGINTSVSWTEDGVGEGFDIGRTVVVDHWAGDGTNVVFPERSI